MGADKALLVVGDRPLAVTAADALRGAGATDVVAVGGDRGGLEAAGLRWIADRWAGEGPLGGLVTALDAAREDVLAVLACDMPNVTAAAVVQVVAALDHAGAGADAAVAVAAGRVHPLLGAYRRSVMPPLRAAFEAGERSLRSPLAARSVVMVALDDPGWAANANRPDDVRVTDRPNRS